MKSKRNILILVAVLIFTPLYFYMDHATIERQKLGTVTTFSKAVGGLGLFYTLAKESTSIDLIKKPILKWEELSQYKAIVMASPLFVPSERQGAILAEYVGYGGTLVLSFHNEATFDIVKIIVGDIAGSGGFTLKEDAHFKNGEAVNVTGKAILGDERLKLFSPAETYTFYSPWRLHDVEEKTDVTKTDGDTTPDNFSTRSIPQDKTPPDLNHYVKIIEAGGGEVIVLAGLPPMGNALIGKTDNKNLSYRLLTTLSPLAIDEYYHGYSDRTIWDLFDLPLFALPITGMIVLMIVYFIFALDPLATIVVGDNKKTAVATSHHRASELIFVDFLSEPKLHEHALNEQARFLKQLFAQDKVLVDKKLNAIITRHKNLKQKKDFLLAARELTVFHNELSQAHGGKKS